MTVDVPGDSGTPGEVVLPGANQDMEEEEEEVDEGEEDDGEEEDTDSDSETQAGPGLLGRLARLVLELKNHRQQDSNPWAP